MRFYFTPVSRNAKTGPMPVVTASNETCPSSCPLMRNGCYAEQGKLGLFWAEVSQGTRPTLSFDELELKLKGLPRGQIWRYGQAGDLPEDPGLVARLAAANR